MRVDVRWGSSQLEKILESYMLSGLVQTYPLRRKVLQESGDFSHHSELASPGSTPI